MTVYYLTKYNIFCESSASANRARSLLEGLSLLGTDVKLLVTDGYLTRAERQKYRRGGKFNSIQVVYLTLLLNESLFQRRMNKYVILPLLSHLLERNIRKALPHHKGTVLWTGVELKYFKFIVHLKQRMPTVMTFIEINEFLDYQRYNRGRIVHVIEGELKRKYLENKALSHYDGIALMTKTLFDYYNNKPSIGAKLLHLPMTVDMERFKNIDSYDNSFIKPYIVYVGLMNDAKDGVSTLIHAFSHIAQNYNEYNLYLVGGWNYDTPIHLKLIKTLNLEERIVWKGEYSRDQIPGIMMNASLLVLPRPETKQTKGGFPTKLGEYLATGNPVCATRIGELPYYLSDGESVFFAEPGSDASFADAMHRALSDISRAKQVGIHGREIAEKHFNMLNQSHQLLDFLKTRI